MVALDANEYVRSGTFTNSFLILDSKRQLLTSTDQQVPLRSPTVHALSMACLCPLRYSVFAVGILATGMVTGVSGWIFPKPLRSVTICRPLSELLPVG